MKKATIALLVICTAVFAQQKGTFTDSRDGKEYKTVKIGKQVWMAENLNYEANSSKCYQNDPSNCQKYGRLYYWGTALESCPSGWHLPSKSEYEDLDKAVGEEIEVETEVRTKTGKTSTKKIRTNNAGKKLKAKSSWNDNGNGTDEHGFSATPGGIGHIDHYRKFIFEYGGNFGYWWTSESVYDNVYSTVYYMKYDKDFTFFGRERNESMLSVRCLQDSKEWEEIKEREEKEREEKEKKEKEEKARAERIERAAKEKAELEARKATVQRSFFTDSRDNKKYKTVKIGEQTWMAENLNYKANGSKCYHNDEANCNKYGRLYNWETATAVCPKGWHLPITSEWEELYKAVDGKTYKAGYETAMAGKRLKANGGWGYYNHGGTDEFGFSALCRAATAARKAVFSVMSSLAAATGGAQVRMVAAVPTTGAFSTTLST